LTNHLFFDRYQQVTTGVTYPSHQGFYSGLGTVFSLSATHKLEQGAVIQEVTGLHVSVRHFESKLSISTQIAALRKLLFDSQENLASGWFKRVTAVCLLPKRFHNPS
jgi:hypothetical protein